MVTTTPALHNVLPMLRCPVCTAAFTWADRALRCEAGHAFDVAKQGYVNLLGRAAPANADTAGMLSARARVLGSGLFDGVLDGLIRAAATPPDGAVVEVGAGTGFYLQGVLAASPGAMGVALDVSPAAARRSASAGLVSIVADTWQPLPLADGCADVVLCVFAPRNPAEFNRILSSDGRVLVVAPKQGHLTDLRARHGLLDVEPDKADRLRSSFAEAGLRETASERVAYEQEAAAELVADLIAMGPNAFHAHAIDADAALVQIDVEVSVFSR